MIARFFGDMFCYLNNCGSSENPGTITKRILETLVAAHEIIERNGEPLIVLSHSMGGQIEYDIVTHFLPKSPKYSNLKIDFWCSVASQVGLFEEMKLFIASSNLYSKQNGNKVPFPDKNYLGAWWNVWDMDDILSYSVSDIIEGVDDMSFRVGHWLINAHVGYLQEKSFYLLFAEHIKDSITAGNSIQV